MKFETLATVGEILLTKITGRFETTFEITLENRLEKTFDNQVEAENYFARLVKYLY